jgi:hypothetical protein
VDVAVRRHHCVRHGLVGGVGEAEQMIGLIGLIGLITLEVTQLRV